MRRRPAVVVVVALLAVAITAVGVVYSKHLSRRLFVQLEELQRDRDRLDVEWGRLQLEQGTWATHGRIEKVARSRLEMVMPRNDKLIILELPEGR